MMTTRVWLNSFNRVRDAWKKLDVDPGELARVEEAARQVIVYISEKYRAAIPEALGPLERMAAAYEARDGAALAVRRVKVMVMVVVVVVVGVGVRVGVGVVVVVVVVVGHMVMVVVVVLVLLTFMILGR